MARPLPLSKPTETVDPAAHPMRRTPERDRELRQNHPRIYLNALMNGRAVTLDNRTYKLFQTGDEIETSMGTMQAAKPVLMCRGVLQKNGAEKEIWLGAQLELAEFAELALKETVENSFLVAAQNALTEEARKRITAREERLAQPRQSQLLELAAV
jgi:hypothetical protein